MDELLTVRHRAGSAKAINCSLHADTEVGWRQDVCICVIAQHRVFLHDQLPLECGHLRRLIHHVGQRVDDVRMMTDDVRVVADDVRAGDGGEGGAGGAAVLPRRTLLVPGAGPAAAADRLSESPPGAEAGDGVSAPAAAGLRRRSSGLAHVRRTPLLSVSLPPVPVSIPPAPASIIPVPVSIIPVPVSIPQISASIPPVPIRVPLVAVSLCRTAEVGGVAPVAVVRSPAAVSGAGGGEVPPAGPTSSPRQTGQEQSVRQTRLRVVTALLGHSAALYRTLPVRHHRRQRVWNTRARSVTRWFNRVTADRHCRWCNRNTADRHCRWLQEHSGPSLLEVTGAQQTVTYLTPSDC